MNGPKCVECGREMEYEDGVFHCDPCGEGLSESTWIKDNEPEGYRDD